MSANSDLPISSPEQAALEISRLTHELRQAKADSARMREMVEKTMRDLAREIRVPLATVLGFTDLLSVNCRTNSAELNQIARAGHQLMDFVNSMEQMGAATIFESSNPPLELEHPRRSPLDQQIVLHIEDNETNFNLVQRILEDRDDLNLVWASNGEKGVAAAAQQHPSLILLDLNLPDMHGSEVLARLQKDSGTKDIPIIVLSADISPTQIERMLQAGARNYLTKPFDIKRLLCIVEESLPIAA